MRLKLGRSSGAQISVAPDRVRPGEPVRVTVTLGEDLDKVASARVALGYVNTYAYRWAGRRDAAARYDDTSIATIGMVGTDHGSEKKADDWVPAGEQALPVNGDTMAAGTHEVTLPVPSWAPGTSDEFVRWVVRLEIDRGGRRDVAEEAELIVVVPAPAPVPEQPLERTMGGACDIDIRLDRDTWRPGETITGTLVLTAPEALPDADLAVQLQRSRTSHPLERTPANEWTRDLHPPVQLGKQFRLLPGLPEEVPFSIVLPEDAGASGETVNATVTWYVTMRVMYKGLTHSHGVDRLRRAFVVYTA